MQATNLLQTYARNTYAYRHERQQVDNQLLLATDCIYTLLSSVVWIIGIRARE